MRLAYFVDEWVTLSQTFIREEVRELRALGADVHVVALRRGDVTPDGDEPATYLGDVAGRSRLGRLDPVLHPRMSIGCMTAMRRLGGESLPHRSVLPRVADHIRTLGVDWCHAHFGWEAAGAAEVVASMVGTGWSFTAHANDIFVANRYLDRRLRHADRLVTVCDYNLRELHARHDTVPPTEVVVCGVRTPVSCGDDVHPDVDIVGVGRLVPKKGFDLLLRAVASMKPTTHGPVSVDLIGDGPERKSLEDLARQLGIADQVNFAGAVPHAQALRRIERARLACLPARVAPDGDRDSMPVVIKEAMARARPVVATDVVGIPEMVDDTVGRLVPPEDAGALADGLAAVLSDPEGAVRMGRAGRRRVEDRFELGDQVQRLLGFFETWATQWEPR